MKKNHAVAAIIRSIAGTLFISSVLFLTGLIFYLTYLHWQLFTASVFLFSLSIALFFLSFSFEPYNEDAQL
jgi:ABC-type multidrug transport system permease subunit